MTRKIEMERFSLTTSKRFDEVIAGVHADINHPDMAEFGRSTHEARFFAELKSVSTERELATSVSFLSRSRPCSEPTFVYSQLFDLGLER